MEINCGEVYAIINSLEARQEWMECENEDTNELSYIKSALGKMKRLKFEIKNETQTN